MMAITGVERIVTSIGLKNELTYGLIPVIIPVPMPRIPDIMKAISPLNAVVPAVTRNLLSPKRVRVVISVFSGEGRTKSDFKCNDRKGGTCEEIDVFHQLTALLREEKTGPFCLDIVDRGEEEPGFETKANGMPDPVAFFFDQFLMVSCGLRHQDGACNGWRLRIHGP